MATLAATLQDWRDILRKGHFLFRGLRSYQKRRREHTEGRQSCPAHTALLGPKNIPLESHSDDPFLYVLHT